MVPDPVPTDLRPYTGLADPEDLPILVSALPEGCLWLVTFNERHDQPGHPEVTVLQPGEFILRVRDLLTYISEEGG